MVDGVPANNESTLTVPDSLSEFFSSAFFMPRGHCYLWKPGLVSLQVLASGGIGLASIVIVSILVSRWQRIRGSAFRRLYLCFALVILGGAATHLFDVYVVWNPAYWLDATIRSIAAIASIGAALLLPSALSKAAAGDDRNKALHPQSSEPSTEKV